MRGNSTCTMQEPGCSCANRSESRTRTDATERPGGVCRRECRSAEVVAQRQSDPGEWCLVYASTTKRMS